MAQLGSARKPFFWSWICPEKRKPFLREDVQYLMAAGGVRQHATDGLPRARTGNAQ
jgi:hypothetical protein